VSAVLETALRSVLSWGGSVAMPWERIRHPDNSKFLVQIQLFIVPVVGVRCAKVRSERC